MNNKSNKAFQYKTIFICLIGIILVLIYIKIMG